MGDGLLRFVRVLGSGIDLELGILGLAEAGLGKHAVNGAPADQQVGIITAPHGLAFAPNGDVYVQDWNASGRITKLRKAQAK